MPETRYMISDTAKQVEVETHVLRYWEEELELPIARNEMGHRYYTEDNIHLFKKIKELKEQGFQLKAIKILIPELEKQGVSDMDNIIHLKEELNRRAIAEEEAKNSQTRQAAEDKSEASPQQIRGGGREEQNNCGTITEHPILAAASADVVAGEVDDKMQQFRSIISDIMTDVLRENNKQLGKEISGYVGDHVIKEMDYLMRMKEEKEEERYKLLDETIRSYQLSRRQVAAAKNLEKKKLKQEKKEKKPSFFARRKQKREDLLL